MNNKETRNTNIENVTTPKRARRSI